MLFFRKGQVICLLILILVFNLFVPFLFEGSYNSTVHSAGFEGEDILKGAGIAIALIVLSQTLFQGRDDSREEEAIDDLPDSEENLARVEGEDEIKLLARVVHGEARGEPYEGQVAVAAVILNRVASSNFPDTIEEVVYQEGQFIAVEDGQYNLDPGESALQASVEALEGEDPSEGAYYFYNPMTARTFWWLRTIEKTVQIGNHVFAK